MRTILAVLASLALAASSCTAPERRVEEGGDPFGREVARWVVEVDYVSGAEPYVGPIGRIPDPWVLVRANVEALAVRPDVFVEVPSALEEMEAIEGSSAEGYGVAEILELSEAHRDLAPSDEVASFHVLFLDGIYYDGTGPRPDVLGLSIEGTTVVAVFKPVVEAACLGPAEATCAFVEQTTVIHELGHAAGLVDEGLAATSDHVDETHPGHCARHDCVMYYANEGAADLLDFARNIVQTGRTVVLCAQCLADAAAAAADAP